MAERIGKFEVRRLLGKGAQSAVYLAYDAHLDREVAIKKLKLTDRDPIHREALLNEARTVSKLRHANIVPIFDAGEQAGEPYLVFEYVEGQTLTQLIKKEGALPAEKAGNLMLGVLDAIEYAHKNNVIHRDLKPSNILVNADGVPRVMDFGIAARVDGGSGGVELEGTPAYMAPEYIAKRIFNAQTDVFAAGLILYEMAFGRRAIEADNPFQAMHKIANQDIKPPAGTKVDEKLVDLIAKATVRDPQQRFQSAQQMRDALAHYLNPLSDADDAEGKKQSTIDFLLRRMRHKSDFPAMSQAISAINRLATSDKGNLHSLSNSILKDFALTNKILRIANSALYRQFGAGTISTISRAIVVLGFDAVRSIALSLMLFEHLQQKQHQDLLREEFLRANFAGVLGKQFAASFGLHRSEEPFICSMFHNLGRLLTHYYFPEEADAINKIITQEKLTEDQAASKVLGIGFQDLGIGIAKSWGFPDELVQSMKRVPAGEDVPTAHSVEDTLRCLSTFSNEVCTVFQNLPASSRQGEIKALQKRYGKNIKLSDKELAQVLKDSTEEITELARVIGLNMKASKLGRQLLPAVEGASTEGAAAAPPALPGGAERLQTSEEVAHESAPASNGAALNAPPAVDVQSVLAAGIQDISQALVEVDSLADLLRIIIETMYRAMGFKRVLLCMRDGRTGQMSARFGFGAGADEAATYFRFTLGGRNDIFNIILSNDKDVLISDASDPKLARFIPEWFKTRFPVQTFIVFPLRIKGSPVAMIYADKDHAGTIAIADKELSLLRTLCNQAILAIKQSAGGR